MKKIIFTLLIVLGITTILFGCDTEVAKFDSVKDAVDTAEKESNEVIEDVVEPVEKSMSDRLNDPDIINIGNSEEFAKILTVNLDESEYAEFFNANKFNIIEFNGAIDAVNLLPNKKTRYELLLRAGDYDENSFIGPTFKVEDVGGNDVGVKDVFLSGNAKTGTNISIVAKVYGYDETRGFVKIKLESIELR